MALATTIKGSAVRFYLGDNADPIVYTRPCGLSTRSVSFNKGTNEVRVPDCDDPDAPSWLEHDVESISIAVSGNGVLAVESIADFFAAWQNTDPINAKIEIVLPTEVLTYTGKVHLVSFEVTGNDGERAQVSIEAQSHGEMAYTTPAVP